jgi:hypothetical protein
LELSRLILADLFIVRLGIDFQVQRAKSTCFFPWPLCANSRHLLAPTKTVVLLEESEQIVMNRAHGVDLVVNVTLVTLCLYSKVK